MFSSVKSGLVNKMQVIGFNITKTNICTLIAFTTYIHTVKEFTLHALLYLIPCRKPNRFQFWFLLHVPKKKGPRCNGKCNDQISWITLNKGQNRLPNLGPLVFTDYTFHGHFFYKLKRVYIRNVFCILFAKTYIPLKLYVTLIFFSNMVQLGQQQNINSISSIMAKDMF